MIFALIVILSWSSGVWPPDVLSKRKIVVCVGTNGSGDQFTVQQFWNSRDFYTIELLHRTAVGDEFKVVIDNDSGKLWTCECRFLSERFQAQFVSKNRVLGTYDWDKRELTRSGNVTIPADRIR